MSLPEGPPQAAKPQMHPAHAGKAPMFRAAIHDDARTMLLSSQVLRLARMRCGPTAAGQRRLSTGFPWLCTEPIGARGKGRS
jgi:hypothetical protein